MAEEEVKIKNNMFTTVTFLERAACVFDAAILATSTSEFRNKLTNLNMERMRLIEHMDEIQSYAKALHELLRKLTRNEIARDEMSCYDTHFGDTTTHVTS